MAYSAKLTGQQRDRELCLNLLVEKENVLYLLSLQDLPSLRSEVSIFTPTIRFPPSSNDFFLNTIKEMGGHACYDSNLIDMYYFRQILAA